MIEKSRILAYSFRLLFGRTILYFGPFWHTVFAVYIDIDVDIDMHADIDMETDRWIYDDRERSLVEQSQPFRRPFSIRLSLLEIFRQHRSFYRCSSRLLEISWEPCSDTAPPPWCFASALQGHSPAAVVFRFGYHHRAAVPNQSALSAANQLQLSRRKHQ
jgi:hypothetical protein